MIDLSLFLWYDFLDCEVRFQTKRYLQGDLKMKEKLGLIGLKTIRKQRNLNQLKVALDLNISREALSYYETGKRSPDVRMLVILSQYFNVSIDYLITGEEFSLKHN